MLVEGDVRSNTAIVTWRDIADTGIWQMNYTAHCLLLLLLYCYTETCGTKHGARVSIHVEHVTMGDGSGSPCGDGAKREVGCT